MTQVIVWMLLMGIVGLSWVIVLDILVTTITPTITGKEAPRHGEEWQTHSVSKPMPLSLLGR